MPPPVAAFPAAAAAPEAPPTPTSPGVLSAGRSRGRALGQGPPSSGSDCGGSSRGASPTGAALAAGAPAAVSGGMGGGDSSASEAGSPQAGGAQKLQGAVSKLKAQALAEYGRNHAGDPSPPPTPQGAGDLGGAGPSLGVAGLAAGRPADVLLGSGPHPEGGAYDDEFEESGSMSESIEESFDDEQDQSGSGSGWDDGASGEAV